ncbi:MAG: translocation/assembly module TamB domain-containing protein, partial [Acidobacteria bacterium]|nr:translocation/assembly module TamB domain-containing protein [Acidobacteriota bacterium]
VVEGAIVSGGSTVNLQTRGEVLDYRFAGRLSNLDVPRLANKLEGTSAWVRETPLTIDSTFEIKGTGEITGTGRGGLKAQDATFEFSELRADVDGAQVNDVQGTGTLASARLTVSATGGVSGFWDRVLLRPEAELYPDGRLSAAVVVPDVTEPLLLESVRANGHLVLGPSKLFGVDVDEVEATATWTGDTVVIEDARVRAHGVTSTLVGDVAVGDTATSSLRFVADASDLSTLTGLLGMEAPGVGGVGHVAGTLTGSVVEPVLDGRLTVGQVVYGASQAQGAMGTFHLTLPDWDLALMRGQAGIEATGAVNAGQAIDRAVVSATFDEAVTYVDVSLDQQDRHVDVGGQVTVQGGATELVVERAQLSGSGQAWQLTPDTDSRIRFADDLVTVQTLGFSSGEERVMVDGGLGADASMPSDDPLRVHAEGIAVGALSLLLTGQNRVRGNLNGDATVTGSWDAPVVAGQFAMTDGTADGVAFTSLAGSAGYAADTVTVDARLDSGVSGFLTFKGAIPIGTVLEGQPAPPVRLQVTGQLPDVGVMGPAVPWVTNLVGAADVDVALTDSLDQPSVAGHATLVNAGFRVPDTGVAYRGLDAAVRFEDTVMVIERFGMLDEDGHQMRMDGSLDIWAQGASRAVNVRARAQGFHVLNNEYGELIVNADLTIGGDIVAPNVLGTVRVERGRFEVDRLLREFVVTRGYEAAGTAAAAPRTSVPLPDVFSGSAMSVEVSLPDDVVVRGRGIQTEEGIIGLGDINLTLGGQLKISKAAGQEAALLGEVSAVRGTYDFQGRRFAIVRGSVLRFRSDDMTNPVLDITAELEISGVDVTEGDSA